MPDLNENPFEFAPLVSDYRSEGRRSFRQRLALAGMLIGGALPLIFTIPSLILGLFRPALPPGYAYSGTSMFVSLVILLIGFPVCTATGGAIGAVIGLAIDGRCSRRKSHQTSTGVTPEFSHRQD